MNIHAAAFLLGCFPAQRCGAVYCRALKSLHLDVALTSFHMQLSWPSRPDIVWALPPMLVTLDVPACSPADLPRRLHCAACLLAVLNVQHIVPVVADPQVLPGLVVLSPNTGCSSQQDVVLTSFQTSHAYSLAHAWLLPPVLTVLGRSGAPQRSGSGMKWPHAQAPSQFQKTIFQIQKFIFPWMKASIRPAQPHASKW